MLHQFDPTTAAHVPPSRPPLASPPKTARRSRSDVVSLPIDLTDVLPLLGRNPPLFPAPPSTPVNGTEPTKRPRRTVYQREPKAPSQSRVERARPESIDARVSPVKDFSPADSAMESIKSGRSLQRESIISNNSIVTFASSDLSSTWTFGNARPVPILPGVTPRAPGTTPAPRRPKSKYGQYGAAGSEKALPGVPKSPLAR